jgi:hypothetical protein
LSFSTQSANSGQSQIKARKKGTRTVILQKDLNDWLESLPLIGKKLVG